MKAIVVRVRALLTAININSHPSSSSSSSSSSSNTIFLSYQRFFYSALPQNPDNHAVFDSSHFVIDDNNNNKNDDDDDVSHNYRERVNTKLFDEKDCEIVVSLSNRRILEREEEKKKKTAALASSLLDYRQQQQQPQQQIDVRDVKQEDQMSLSVGIIGAPNAGKSALTNCIVGTKVSAVSRKINTTTHEVLGVMTQGTTQICFFDTPGLMLKKSGIPYRDIKIRNQSAWSSIDLYDVLIVIFDVHRHVTRPDSRVVRLIERMGSIASPSQKRVLCMNKVDLVPKKNDLLRVAKEFKDLPGYDKHFLISGLKGAGVKDLTRYLEEQAVKRPWDEDPFAMSEEVMKSISLEVVREKLLDYVHQEIPYGIEHRLMGWKELRDGSIRIEQHLITHKMSQRKILVGSKGSKIGRIGMEANEELRSIFKRNVHLILMVRLK